MLPPLFETILRNTNPDKGPGETGWLRWAYFLLKGIQVVFLLLLVYVLALLVVKVFAGNYFKERNTLNKLTKLKTLVLEQN
ncbi:MAG: hypothetical protein ACO1OQ_10115 [Rufibacter sp.]